MTQQTRVFCGVLPFALMATPLAARAAARCAPGPVAVQAHDKGAADASAVDAPNDLEQKVLPSGAANDWLGWSVALSGDTALVGVSFDDVAANGAQGPASAGRGPLTTSSPPHTTLLSLRAVFRCQPDAGALRYLSQQGAAQTGPHKGGMFLKAFGRKSKGLFSDTQEVMRWGPF